MVYERKRPAFRTEVCNQPRVPLGMLREWRIWNRDGSPDLLVRNKTTGDVRVWYLHGIDVIGQAAVARECGPWDIAGVGDFNGDGNPDIVWRNPSTGETVVWYMKGVLPVRC